MKIEEASYFRNGKDVSFVSTSIRLNEWLGCERLIKVAAAIIENDQGQILIARRKKGKAQEGLWEFPGGKIETGETIEDCLKRELKEEMNISIAPYESFGVNDHRYEALHIRLYAHKAKHVSGELMLVDHDQYDWVYPCNLGKYEFAPADIPFVQRLMKHP